MRPVDTGCPNCNASGMDVFYEVKDIPGHSCLMLDDRQAALEYPKRNLSLGFCRACGFISNVIFDAHVLEYSARYEEQQSFSPRFRAFQTELIARLIAQYDVRDKDVVEIGCGKGDFLVELCEAGRNRGVGIDPACDPERMQGRGDGRVHFIRDFYSERCSEMPCDFLCCRHTLEHMHPTNEFVGLTRKVVGDRSDMIVFFEVPAVERVLGEAAFWDIYYEHCSYFSLGSLARVFRANRFEIIELATDFDDQYLLIVARPVDKPTAPLLPEEDDLEQITHDVADFSVKVMDRISTWRSRVIAFREGGKRIAVWGSGSKCVAFLSTVGVAGEIETVVDINPYRHGKWLPGSGKQVAAPESLRGTPADVVLVMNPIYCEEIRRDLDAMGVSADLVPV